MTKLARLPANDRAPASGTAGARRIVRPKTRYFAFLSYSHRDKEMADWLHSELEEFRVPPTLAGKLTENGVTPKRLTPIFRDQHELAAADDLGEEIEEALAASQFLVVLCSPDAAKSRWTNAEIDTFKRTRPDGCVFAAIIAGEPFASDIPGREAEECFPPALRQRYDRRGRPTGKRAEPLAADLREEGDGRRLGFLKLVAGMLGVGLDDLVQRETTQRHRRLAWLTAASLAGMAVTSTLALVALGARDEARDQRREAEGLVAFMLGDLKDKLEPIGRLDALDGVGSRVLAYYSKQDASELSDAALLQRARALSLTAQVAYLRGNQPQAADLYAQAAAGTAEAVRRSPDDPQRLFDHAQNVFWTGELARFRGQLSEAEAAYREYKSLADRMVSLEPDNLRWRMEAAYADENLGTILFYQRRFPEAARQLTGALRTMESLASIDRANAEYQKEVSTVLAWLADAERAQGHLDRAVALRTRQANLLRGLLSRDPANVAYRQELIPAQQALGRLLASRGEGHEAVEQFRSALGEADRLIPIEPGNQRWRALAAGARIELARTLLGLEQHADAAREANTGCEQARVVLASDAGAAWRSLRTDCFSVRANLALQAGANARALQLAEQALASARTERSPDLATVRYSVAAAQRLVGDARRRLGDEAGARAAWTAALSYLPQAGAERPVELKERAELLQRLGRGEEAKQISQRLAAMGYRGAT